MPPTKLAHIVFQTNQIGPMRDWYCATLDARVIHENQNLCFVTYDDEHHRIAFLDPGPLAPHAPILPGRLVDTAEPPGLHHAAFTYASMGSFLDNYVRLKGRGIVPFRCINHGPTTSMYYRDPDGNRVELQIDNFATAQEGRDWLSTPAFAENPIGVEYDPDQLVARFRAGVPVGCPGPGTGGLMPVRSAPARIPVWPGGRRRAIARTPRASRRGPWTGR